MAARRKTGRHSSKGPRKKGSTPPDSDGIVVYMHGIGRHPAADVLKLEWDIALFGSDRQHATRMAYWSDLVHPATGPAAKRARSTSDDARIDLSPAAILARAGVNPQDKHAREFAERLLNSLGSTGAGGRTRKKVLPLPGFLRRPLSRAFLEAFVGDAAAYFFDEAKRVRIRKRLSDALPAGGDKPITLVAHSLGSVIALEVLAKQPATFRSFTLVTMGSPLGLQEVQDFLDVPPGERPFRVPGFVRRWHNFADPFDPVALDHGLSGEFVVDSSSGSEVDPLTDEVILNDRSRRLVGFNPHAAVGYLAHPKVRRAVHAGAQWDSMSRFVVARDVAEALGAEVRQPVLIEILDPGYHALGEQPNEVEGREKEERLRAGLAPAKPILLSDRIERAARDIEALVTELAGSQAKQAVAGARIDRLRRFVAARLTPDEIRRIARDHRGYNVYRVWRSASKKKLIWRSRAVLQADAALESYGASGRDITWAVLDTGIRSDHPHFKGRIEAIWDCTKPGRVVRLAKDADRDGHGSHVGGIIAGAGQDERNRPHPALAPAARLVVYKVLDDKGEGEDAWIIKALDHIAEQNENKASIGIHGLNLSLGGPYDSTVYGCGFTPICQELRRLWRSGVLVVVACGNEGQLEVQTGDGEVEINTPMSIGDPANLEDCIAVGSVNADRPHLYGVSAFSSRGPTSDGRVKPDVVAPGESISSVNARYSARRAGQRPYREESGTSMAAPHVSGLLAAFLSARREFRGRPDEVKRLLLDACTDLGRDRHHQGRGLPNLMKMLLSV